MGGRTNKPYAVCSFRDVGRMETDISARAKRAPTRQDHGNTIYISHPLWRIDYPVRVPVHLEDQALQDHHYYQEYQVVKEKN